jgi:adenine-specific DNA-methyltransferase
MATGDGRRNSKSLHDFELVYSGKLSKLDVLNRRPLFQKVHVHAPDTRNALYFGENLDVLLHLLHDKSLRGKVDLVYIDPPYASQSIFNSRDQTHAYNDLLVGTEYIEFIRQRLIVIHELLKNTGSIYVHVDQRMGSYVRLILDEIFGPENFRNEITRKKCNPKNYTKNNYGNISDVIFFYSKSATYTWNRPYSAWGSENSEKEYSNIEKGTGRRFKKVPIHAPGVRNGATGGEWRGKLPPPGKHWQYTPARLDEMDSRGEIYWSPSGNPRRKVYLDQSSGIPVQDIWLDVKDAHNQNIEITGYPTEKNPDLLRRIIEASSNPGDLVLDCFAGSGTTAHQSVVLNRDWIAIDESEQSILTIIKRLKYGLYPMGDFVTSSNKSKKKRTNESTANTKNENFYTCHDLPYNISSALVLPVSVLSLLELR